MILWEAKAAINSKYFDKPETNSDEANKIITAFIADKVKEINANSKEIVGIDDINNCCFLADLHLQPDVSGNKNKEVSKISNYMWHKNVLDTDKQKELITLDDNDNYNIKRVQIQKPANCDTLIFLGDTFTGDQKIKTEYDRFSKGEIKEPTWFTALKILLAKFKNIYYLEGNHDYKHDLSNVIKAATNNNIYFIKESYGNIIKIKTKDRLVLLTHDPVIIFCNSLDHDPSLDLFRDKKTGEALPILDWYKLLFKKLSEDNENLPIDFIFGHFHDTKDTSSRFNEFTKLVDKLSMKDPKVTAHHVSWSMLDTQVSEDGETIQIKPLTLNQIIDQSTNESYLNASFAFKYLSENFK